MNVQKCIEEMKSIQCKLLEFIDNESNEEEYYQNLIALFIDLKICEDQNKLKLFLHLLSKIGDNHHYNCNIFKKIEQILNYLKESIKKYFSNNEIFNIFVKNKRILLFLIEEKILIINARIAQIFNTYKFTNKGYYDYFLPEIRPFLDKENEKNNKSNHELLFATPEKKIPEIKSESSDTITKKFTQYKKNIEKQIQEFKEIYSISDDSSSDNDNNDENIQIKQERDSNKIESDNENNTNSVSISNSEDDDNSFNITDYVIPDENENNSSESVRNTNNNSCSNSEDDDNSFNITDYVIPVPIYNDENENNSSESVRNTNNNSCSNSEDEIDLLNSTSNSDRMTKKEESFFELRRIGQNESLICKLIREDKVEEFISYVNKNNYSLTGNIEPSIYETNRFLIKNKYASLIEYAAFYGSVQIFKYLKLNNVELESSIWLYAIHGNNAEIIHMLEDNNVEPYNHEYDKIIKEAIKCHHNDIAIYIENNLIENANYGSLSLKYHNYSLLKDEDINISNLENFYKYDYYVLSEFYLKQQTKIDKSIRQIFYSFIYQDKNIEMIQLLLSQKNININKLCENVDKDHDYGFKSFRNALHLAVGNENIDIIKLLLSYEKINVNVLSQTEASLMRNREDENFSYEDKHIRIKQKTALFMAVEKENIEIVKLLLSNEKIDVNAVNFSNCYTKIDDGDWFYIYEYKITALYMAILKGNIEIIKLLLSKSDINVNALNVVNYSDSYSTSIDSDSSSFSDTDNDNVDFDNKPSIKEEKQTALYLAILNKNEEIINLLLANKNIDINKYSLIGLNNDERLINAFHLSIENGYHDLVQKLLNTGKIDVNIPCIYESKDKTYMKTSLFMAIENNDIKMVELLLSCNKIDVNIINKGSYSIYQYKSDVKSKYVKYEKTALYRAVEIGSFDIVELLLSNYKIDVNIINSIISIDNEFKIYEKKKRIALHEAVKNKNIEIIMHLLENNEINCDLQDENGKEAIDYVRNVEIINLIENRTSSKKSCISTKKNCISIQKNHRCSNFLRIFFICICILVIIFLKFINFKGVLRKIKSCFVTYS